MERRKIVGLVFSILLFTGCATKQTLPLQEDLSKQSESSFIAQSVLGSALVDLENKQNNTGLTVQLLPKYGGEYLRIGDVFDVDLLSSQDAFLQLYLFQNSGTVLALAENYHVSAGQKVAFPPLGSDFQLRAHPPTGNNTLLLMATKRPISGTIYHDGRHLIAPKRIISTQLGAIAEIKNQLRNFSANEWQSAIRDIPVYR